MQFFVDHNKYFSLAMKATCKALTKLNMDAEFLQPTCDILRITYYTKIQLCIKITYLKDTYENNYKDWHKTERFTSHMTKTELTFDIPYLRMYKPHFFDKNLPSKIGVRLKHFFF
jgi:hypothetical protein